MPTTRERLLALHRAEPNLNQTQLAERLSVTRQRVKQIIDDERLQVERGPRGIGARRRPETASESPPAVTGGIPGLPTTGSTAVAVFLAAADLASKGFSVFVPVFATTSFDLIAIDKNDNVERVAVRRARRVAGEVRYDEPVRGKHDRRAMILTDEPVYYEPAINRKARNG